MNKLLLLLVVFLAFAPYSVVCCGNEYETYTLSDGSTVNTYDGRSNYYFEQGFDPLELKIMQEQLEKKLESHKTFQTLSDYALVLLKQGKHKESLTILQDLNKNYPKEYNIVANLGTAYELNGQVDSALKYIQKAIQINPQSHNGSEWIHVKILEAKKIKSVYYVTSLQTILGLNIQIDKRYSKEELNKYTKIKNELEWQLRERIQFVKDPDPVVAELLCNFADLVAITEYIEPSMPIYNLSLTYAGKNGNPILIHRDKANEILYWSKVRSTIFKWIGLVVFLFLVLYIFLKIKKRRKEKKIHQNEIPVFTSATFENNYEIKK